MASHKSRSPTSRSDIDSDDDNAQYGIAELPSAPSTIVESRSRGKQMTISLDAKPTASCKALKTSYKQDAILSARLDQIEGRLSNIEEANREILKMLKAIQAVLPRVLSSSDGGPFQTNTRAPLSTPYYMP